MNDIFDIIVIGGGTAGVVAAVQAARTGYETLLIEKNGLPGGTMSAGGVAFPGLFYAWRQQIISGIGWELVSLAAAECGTPLPEFEKQIGMKEHPRYQVRLDPLIYALCCEEKMLDAGVHVLYHSMPGKITMENSGAAVTVCTREGLRDFHAKRLIDCSGDASAAAMAGFEVLHPFPCQPATFNCRLTGFDPDTLDWKALQSAADREVEGGELLYSDLGWKSQMFSGTFIRKRGDNGNHIFPELPPHTAEGRSALEQAAHRSLLRAYRFLRRQPGLENLKMKMTAFECGVRESAVIKGEYTVTGEDYISARKFPDAVCNAFYPIDLHGENGVAPAGLREGAVPQVPLRALLPQKSNFLLVAGRCISSDRRANSALRVQATCMATAQAAAAAACVSLRQDVSVRQVSAEDVRELLKRHGAILPLP